MRTEVPTLRNRLKCVVEPSAFCVSDPGYGRIRRVAPANKGYSGPEIDFPPAAGAVPDGESRADMKRVDDFRQRSPGRRRSGQPEDAGVDRLRRSELLRGLCLPVACRAKRARAWRSARTFSATTWWASFWTPTTITSAAYEFFVNPFGIQADAIESEGAERRFQLRHALVFRRPADARRGSPR